MSDRPPASTPHGLATNTGNLPYLAYTTTLATVFARSLGQMGTDTSSQKSLPS
jgi:hypothetical protein